MREKLKEPFGVLIKGSSDETIKIFAHLLEREQPTKIVSVGDTVSKNLHKHKIIPQLSITDSKTMRKKIKPSRFAGKEIVRVENPQGTITKEAIFAIREALKRDCKVHIVVNGEEDLLTLVAVLYAPENSFVVYGQPSEGIVVVKVTAEKKTETREILKQMKVGNVK
ncbi:MAG: GTP-dependent dephospho-CoA kinase family protein [Candidatus Bathyarchaeota archaeon]|nr:GTP-dependent dephospho-CoA kinase family protein [Candidatus Bathyarchaeota archaeon]